MGTYGIITNDKIYLTPMGHHDGVNYLKNILKIKNIKLPKIFEPITTSDDGVITSGKLKGGTLPSLSLLWEMYNTYHGNRDTLLVYDKNESSYSIMYV